MLRTSSRSLIRIITLVDRSPVHPAYQCRKAVAAEVLGKAENSTFKADVSFAGRLAARSPRLDHRDSYIILVSVTMSAGIPCDVMLLFVCNVRSDTNRCL